MSQHPCFGTLVHRRGAHRHGHHVRNAHRDRKHPDAMPRGPSYIQTLSTTSHLPRCPALERPLHVQRRQRLRLVADHHAARVAHLNTSQSHRTGICHHNRELHHLSRVREAAGITVDPGSRFNCNTRAAAMEKGSVGREAGPTLQGGRGKRQMTDQKRKRCQPSRRSGKTANDRTEALAPRKTRLGNHCPHIPREYGKHAD